MFSILNDYDYDYIITFTTANERQVYKEMEVNERS